MGGSLEIQMETAGKVITNTFPNLESQPHPTPGPDSELFCSKEAGAGSGTGGACAASCLGLALELCSLKREIHLERKSKGLLCLKTPLRSTFSVHSV